ncbi:MAG: tRNA(His) guanylyltransferase Thg1 family protein [bacterium]
MRGITMSDELGNRMKFYEFFEASRKCLPLLPVCARLDGKCFSKFTKGMVSPYDINMFSLMMKTTKKLLEETNAIVVYTQSDEIS